MNQHRSLGIRHALWFWCRQTPEARGKLETRKKWVKRHHGRKQFLATQSKMPDCKEPSTSPVEKVRRNFQTDSFVTTSNLLPIMSGLQLLTGRQWRQLWKSLLQTKVYLSWVSSRGLTSCRWNPLFPDLRHDWSCSVQRGEQVDDSPCTLAIEGWSCFGWTNSAYHPLHDIGGLYSALYFNLPRISVDVRLPVTYLSH